MPGVATLPVPNGDGDGVGHDAAHVLCDGRGKLLLNSVWAASASARAAMACSVLSMMVMVMRAPRCGCGVVTSHMRSVSHNDVMTTDKYSSCAPQ
ncbi:hypothetical protein JOD62_002869 [Microbacterium keratanolyticum]|nr:hypothetical protein [Microbacterium keratanolyticum]